MAYWAMRTSRDSPEYRRFITEELVAGRLRQGWGYHESQDLKCIHKAWREETELTDMQLSAAKHWRMADGPDERYMHIGDVVLVPNMPADGLFTLARITGAYQFEIPCVGDFGHFRPVEVLTPQGVANQHPLVQAPLRRSLRYQGRLWNVSPHSGCLEAIIQSDLPPEELTQGVTAEGRIDSFLDGLVVEPIGTMAGRLAEKLKQYLQSSEWEGPILEALAPLFPVTRRHTGGPSEHGADLEITISNPFDENDWIVPVQVKDHQGLEGEGVLSQLEQAYVTREEEGQVIAVVLLVTDAEPSAELKQGMMELRGKYGVPFLYLGGEDLMRLLARGFLKRRV